MDQITLPRDDGNSDEARECPDAEAGGSVTRWLDDLKAGDERAMQALWDRYFRQLAGMIRSRLRAAPGSSATRDEEDIALSVLDALNAGVRDARFPRLDDRGDLWRVLAHLVKCKLADRRRRQQALRNPDLRTWGEADLIAGAPGPSVAAGSPLDRLLAAGPSPDLAAEMAEQLRLRLGTLTKADDQRIAELKLMGHTNEEIAGELGCSLRKVTLRLEWIRKIWQERAEDGPRDGPADE